MYLLNGFTWFMIGNHCDFTKRMLRSVATEESEQVLLKKRQLTHRIKLVILYILVPIMMIVSTSCILIGAVNNERFHYLDIKEIQVSKGLVNISSFLTFVLFSYSLIKLIYQRRNDYTTENKVKFMWMYIILALSFRIFFFFYQTFSPPKEESNSDNFTGEAIYTLFYNIFLFNGPILILSYLSEKQL